MTNTIFFEAVARNGDPSSPTSCSEISSVPPQGVGEASVPLYSVISKAWMACAGGDNDGTYSFREPLSSSVNLPPQLQTATRLFDRSNMLGGGVFGPVFKSWIDPTTLTGTESGKGIPVAVKMFRHGSPKQVTKWLEEIRYWGRFCHPNLLTTIGYSTEDQQCLLVSEFMPQGSLEDHLLRLCLAARRRSPGLGGDSDFVPLSWSHRMKIALGAAKCLAFLHENDAVHGNFKPSNILLDSDYNPKLSFGVAKESPTYVEDIYGLKTSRLDFVNEYTSPECFLEGHPTCQGDVYSFGVVLLEMLIGRKVKRSELKQASAHKGEVKLMAYLDISCLENRHALRDAKRVLRIASRCLSGDEYFGLSMVKIVSCLTRYLSRAWR